MNIALVTDIPELTAAAATLAQAYGLTNELPEDERSNDFCLELTLDGLELVWRSRPDLQPLQLSFTHGSQAWRQQQGGGRQEAVVRALGVGKGYRPSVLDATAGLGRDGMMLAHAGCQVYLLERHPAVHALLDQAVVHAQQDERIGAWVKQLVRVLPRGSLIDTDVLSDAFQDLKPAAIYLDPMFPERGKAAAVKKDMQMLQALVGDDADADNLLPAALALASHRVVVKRPASAPYLSGQKPSSQITTKKHRFDVYVKKAYG